MPLMLAMPFGVAMARMPVPPVSPSIVPPVQLKTLLTVSVEGPFSVPALSVIVLMESGVLMASVPAVRGKSPLLTDAGEGMVAVLPANSMKEPAGGGLSAPLGGAPPPGAVGGGGGWRGVGGPGGADGRGGGGGLRGGGGAGGDEGRGRRGRAGAFGDRAAAADVDHGRAVAGDGGVAFEIEVRVGRDHRGVDQRERAAGAGVVCERAAVELQRAAVERGG